MSTITTLRSMVDAAMHRQSPYRDAAISDAFRDVRGEETWFNGRTWQFALATDVSEYPLPEDFFGVRGAVWKLSGGDTTSRIELMPMTVDSLERYRYGGFDILASPVEDWRYEFSGETVAYAIDKNGRKFLVAPVPASGGNGDVIRMRYTADLGIGHLGHGIDEPAAASAHPDQGDVGFVVGGGAPHGAEGGEQEQAGAGQGGG